VSTGCVAEKADVKQELRIRTGDFDPQAIIDRQQIPAFTIAADAMANYLRGFPDCRSPHASLRRWRNATQSMSRHHIGPVGKPEMAHHGRNLVNAHIIH